MQVVVTSSATSMTRATYPTSRCTRASLSTSASAISMPPSTHPTSECSLASSSASSKLPLLVGFAMQWFFNLLQTTRSDIVGLSDTVRLSAAAGSSYCPVGYSHLCPSDLGLSRVINAEFNAASTYISNYCSEEKRLLGCCVVDFRMMPGTYGRNNYGAIEKSLIILLLQNSHHLTNTFSLELPFTENYKWPEIQEAVLKSQGYNVEEIEWNKGLLVESNLTTENPYLTNDILRPDDSSLWIKISRNSKAISHSSKRNSDNSTSGQPRHKRKKPCPKGKIIISISVLLLTTHLSRLIKYLFMSLIQTMVAATATLLLIV